MKRHIFYLIILTVVFQSTALAAQPYGQLLPSQDKGVTMWWCSSGHKVTPDQPAPTAKGNAITIRAARNETEAAQLIVRPARKLGTISPSKSKLVGPAGAVIPAENIELLRVGYVTTTIATDKSATVGDWPDPLPPFDIINLTPNRNQPFWVRVKVPRDIPAGVYKGRIGIVTYGMIWDAPLEVEVYDFNLPDRMTCVTAFGFSPGNVWRYHNLKTESQKREVLDKYFANFAAHHISPYNLAPMDPIRTTWPAVKPPPSKFANWQGLRIVDNETHTGNGAALIYDDNPKANLTLSYEPLIPIPDAGLHFRFAYRTAVPDHRFNISLNHYDADGKWLWGKNNDTTLKGSGKWQSFDEVVRDFPAEAKFVRANIRATQWTDAGDHTGLVWIDDVSITNPQTKKEFIEAGDFNTEKRTKLVAPAEQLKAKIDFTAWDKAMKRAIAEIPPLFGVIVEINTRLPRAIALTSSGI